VGNRCADHVTPLYPQKLALTSPTGDGRSVGIVRSRTKATEFSLLSEGLKTSTEEYAQLYPTCFHDFRASTYCHRNAWQRTPSWDSRIQFTSL